MKIGDTLKATGLHKDSAGAAVDLLTAQITVTSGLLSPDGCTRVPFEVTIDPDQVANKGKFLIVGQTTGLRPGKGWQWDTRYTDSSGYSWSDDSTAVDLSESGV
jgi:hypothetical protein